MGLESHEVTQSLIAHLQKNPQDRALIAQRLLDLLPQNDNPQYAHPQDVALAAYLYALSVVDPQRIPDLAEQVINTPQLWWSMRLAKEMIKSLQEDASSERG